MRGGGLTRLGIGRALGRFAPALQGVFVLLGPQIGPGGAGDAGSLALLPLGTALCFAPYGVLTRLASRDDQSRTTFFYTGVPGVVVLGFIGPFFWASPTFGDWLWIGPLCVTGMTSHHLLIRAYELLDAVAVQPLTYFQLVVGGFVGVFIFGEVLTANLLLGAGIVVSAGAFTIWREHVVARRARADASRTG